MKSTFLKRPSVIIPLLILAATLAFPQSRNYLLIQLGVSQTKWGYISSLIFGSNKERIFKTPHTQWEKWDQLIATIQSEKEENYSDVYIKKHPEQTWLLAERIRTLLNYCSLPWRGERQFARREYNPPSMPGSKKDELRATATTKVLFPRVIHLCNLGKQQEPQNAYYDLILAGVAYGEYRDQDGWRHFQEASKKPIFEPHYQDLLQMQLLIDRKIAGHPLISEEKFTAEGVIKFRDLSFFRTLTNWLQWWAAEDIRAGNIPKAMEMQETMSRMGSLIARQARRNYVNSTGTLMMTKAVLAPWVALQKSEYLPGPPHKRVSREQQFKYVEQFAHQHNLPALLQMETANFQYNYYRLRAINSADNARLSIYEEAVPVVSWNVCVWMLAFMIGAIAAWMVLLFYRKHSFPLSRALRFTFAITSVAIILLLLLTFYYLRLGSEEQLHRNLGPDIFYANAYRGQFLLAVVARALAFCVPLVISFMACGIVTFLFHRRKLKEARKHYSFKRRTKVLLADAAVLLVALWIPAIIAVCRVLAEYFMDRWDFFYFNPELTTIMFSLLGLIMIVGAGYLLFRYIRAKRIDAERKYWKTVYSAIRFSLSGALLSFAILFGVSMIITTVSRQRIEKRLAPFYQKGEMQAFGDKRDLTTPMTAAQFFEYQETHRRKISNRIDW